MSIQKDMEKIKNITEQAMISLQGMADESLF